MALKDYKKAGKTVEEFEKDYNCAVIYNTFNDIKDIQYNNDASKTMLKIKYE